MDFNGLLIVVYQAYESQYMWPFNDSPEVADRPQPGCGPNVSVKGIDVAPSNWRQGARTSDKWFILKLIRLAA